MNARPRITVITPSFNQAEFLEQTLRSVIEQGYPDLEYFVVDGGSTDGSRAIIERHARELSWWTSEPDRGQTHAINKGLRRATGEIVCWLNSDDCFEPATLHRVAELLAPASGYQVINGHSLRVEPDGTTRVLQAGPADHDALLRYWRPYPMHQPSVFWRREVTQRIGGLDESQHLAMDYEYWLRIARHYECHFVDAVLSRGQAHAAAKTGAGFDRYLHERRKLAWREARATGKAAQLWCAFFREGLYSEFDALLRPLWPRRWKGLRRRLRGGAP